MKIKRLAIANRGEIAVRIIKACKELGIQSLLLHSPQDQNSLAFRLADETHALKGNPLTESYLDTPQIIKKCLKIQADALHPGYGFLSENPLLAKACLENKILFIGPHAQHLELLGNKIECKKRAQALNIPTLPLLELNQWPSPALSFPLILKARSGGGGKGMRIINSEKELKEQIPLAQKEASHFFGDSHLFLEPFLTSAKHIEVQVFVSPDHKVHLLSDRECSLQRKQQKIIEEAPAPSLSPSTREKLYEASQRLVESVSYQNAATIEFLVENDQFYFLEVNPRLQVEHPVTEMILNTDLVQAQILAAQGESLLFQNLTLSGHALESRILAENSQGWPSMGSLLEMKFLDLPHSRFDFGFSAGDTLSPFYDSLLGKITVHSPTREQAIEKMLTVLNESFIFGIQTNFELLKAIFKHPLFRNKSYTHQFLKEHFPEGLPTSITSEEENLVKSLYQKMKKKASAQKIPILQKTLLQKTSFSPDSQNPFSFYGKLEKKENPL